MSKTVVKDDGGVKPYLTGYRRRDIVRICKIIEMRWFAQLDTPFSELLYDVLDQANVAKDVYTMTDEQLERAFQDYGKKS